MRVFFLFVYLFGGVSVHKMTSISVIGRTQNISIIMRAYSAIQTELNGLRKKSMNKALTNLKKKKKMKSKNEKNGNSE